MELWIRNQNRKVLTKIHSISIEAKTSTKFSIVGNNEWRLGIYETEERALEVLDEIQENIIKQGQVIILTDERGIPNGSKFFGYVYEMPKE